MFLFSPFFHPVLHDVLKTLKKEEIKQMLCGFLQNKHQGFYFSSLTGGYPGVTRP